MMRKWYYILLLAIAFGCQDNNDQSADLEALEAMFEEIETIANSIACTDAAEWSITPYGSKACGGPQGYIAYSNQIDVASFLLKVEQYSQAEYNYNIRWGIISTCDLPAAPTGVSCENDVAVLIY